MARQKEYKEEEVIEKATELFWKNGYESTSMRSLEKAMGINKFSIYSSFGSKQGVFVESIKCYKNKIQAIVEKFKNSNNGISDIKQFFYDFLEFSRDNDRGRGCLLTSTASELGRDGDAVIMSEIMSFTDYLKSILKEKLIQGGYTEQALISKKVNYLIIAKQGLSNASKMFNEKELGDFIETIFESI